MNPSIEIIPISKRIDDSDIHLKKITIGSGGPRLFLGASIHGDELTPIAVLWKLIEYFRVSKVNGTLTMISGMNPEGLAFLKRVDPYFNVDLNRIYPGDPDGTLPQRIANAIYRIAVEHDVVIDLHTAGDCIPFILLDPIEGDLKKDVIELATAMGITVLDEYVSNRYEAEKLGNSLPPQVLKENIPSFTLELPGGDRIDWTGVNVGFKAILNLMIHMGMVDAKKNDISEAFVLGELGYRRYDVSAGRAGILENFVRLGEYVEKFTPLGVVRDLVGNVVEWVKSEKPGYVVSRPSKSVVYPADRLYLLAVND